jgi:hypothetical protein
MTNPIITQIQDTKPLTRPMRKLVRAWSKQHATWPSLEEAYQAALKAFPDWFIYRGGNHVAIHVLSGDDRRVLFIA